MKAQKNQFHFYGNKISLRNLFSYVKKWKKCRFNYVALLLRQLNEILNVNNIVEIIIKHNIHSVCVKVKAKIDFV